MQHTTPRRGFRLTHLIGIVILIVVFFNLFPVTYNTPEWYVAVHMALGQIGQGIQHIADMAKARGK